LVFFVHCDENDTRRERGVSGSIRLVDVELEGLVDEDDIYAEYFEGEDEDWVSFQLERQVKIFGQKLAIRNKEVGCDYDLKIRSCEVQVIPYKPRVHKGGE